MVSTTGSSSGRMAMASATAMNAPAVIKCSCAPYVPLILARYAVMGATSGVPPANVSATSKSFHTHRNWKIANDASAGTLRGSTIDRNRVNAPAPSMRAAS